MNNEFHINCEYERCPICNPDPICGCNVSPSSHDHSHQFIVCTHNYDVVYCKGSEDHDELFDRGVMYHTDIPHGSFEIPISDWSERFWLRGFLENVIDTRSKALNDPNFEIGKKSEIHADLLDDIEIAREILTMLDQGCQSLTLTGEQMLKFEHVLKYSSHLRGCKECKDSMISENKKWDRYDNDPLQDDDYNYLMQDELKYVDKFLNTISDIRSRYEMR